MDDGFNGKFNEKLEDILDDMSSGEILDSIQEDFEYNWEKARCEYDLPDYEKEKYKRFVIDCCNVGLEDVRNYRGRCFYEGPGVVVSDISKVAKITKVPIQWDNMGLDYIVYPK